MRASLVYLQHLLIGGLLLEQGLQRQGHLQLNKQLKTHVMGLGDLRGNFKVYTGIVENNMETTIVYWGNIGILEIKWKLP